MSKTTTGPGDDEPLESADLVRKSNNFGRAMAEAFFARNGKNCRCKHCSAAWVLALSFLKERVSLELEAAECMSHDDWLLMEDVEAEGLDNIEGGFDRRAEKAVKLVDTILQSVKDEEEPK